MEKTIKITDILENPIFVKSVRENLTELLNARHSRPDPKPGFRYSRDWYDRMNSEGVLNTAYFIEHIPSIWIKKSNLNAEYRAVIKHVCDKALAKVLSTNQTSPPADQPSSE